MSASLSFPFSAGSLASAFARSVRARLGWCASWAWSAEASAWVVLVALPAGVAPAAAQARLQPLVGSCEHCSSVSLCGVGCSQLA